MINELEKNALRGMYSVVCILDCSGAFDNLRFKAAKTSMEKLGVPDQLVGWYSHLLKGRTVTAKIKNVTKRIKPTRGSTQGGVLSPFVWNLTMNTLMETFQSGPSW